MRDRHDRRIQHRKRIGARGPTVLTGYQWEDGNEASSDIVEAAARVTDRDPETFSILHERVEVDALNALISTDADEGGRVTVSFTYDGTAVTVANTGTIIVDTGPGEDP